MSQNLTPAPTEMILEPARKMVLLLTIENVPPNSAYTNHLSQSAVIPNNSTLTANELKVCLPLESVSVPPFSPSPAPKDVYKLTYSKFSHVNRATGIIRRFQK